MEARVIRSLLEPRCGSLSLFEKGDLARLVGDEPAAELGVRGMSVERPLDLADRLADRPQILLDESEGGRRKVRSAGEEGALELSSGSLQGGAGGGETGGHGRNRGRRPGRRRQGRAGHAVAAPSAGEEGDHRRRHQGRREEGDPAAAPRRPRLVEAGGDDGPEIVLGLHRAWQIAKPAQQDVVGVETVFQRGGPSVVARVAWRHERTSRRRRRARCRKILLEPTWMPS
jgi:hypothetical protein